MGSWFFCYNRIPNENPKTGSRMETVLFLMPSDVKMVFCFRYICLTFHNRILICFFQPDPDLKKKTGFRFSFFDRDHDRD